MTHPKPIREAGPSCTCGGAGRRVLTDGLSLLVCRDCGKLTTREEPRP